MKKLNLNQNEMRREKKIAQKRAAQKRSKKNSFKKIETIKRVYNEIPYDIVDIYTFGYMSDSESIWKEYNNIGFGGKLILKGDDNVEYIITRHCNGFSRIEILIFDLIEGVPVSWKDEWFSLSQKEKDLYKSRYESGNYISNHYVTNASENQYGIKENIIFWEIKKHTNNFKAGHMYAWEKDFMIMYYEIFISSSDKINEEEIDEWFDSTARKHYDHINVNPKGLALLYITLKKIGYEQHTEFFTSNKELLKNTCEILTHVINEDIVSFIYNIINGNIANFNIKILYKYLEYYLDHFNKDKLSLQGIIATIKHSKWVYAAKYSNFRDNKMHEKYEYFNPSKEFKSLKEGFELKFKRAPKILDVIYSFAVNNNITITEIIDKFNVKFIGRLLKIHNAYNTLYINYLFPELETMSENIIIHLRDKNREIIEWTISHKKCNEEFIIDTIDNFYYISSKIDIQKSNVDEIKKILLEMESLKEFEKVQKKYNFSELKCSIENTEVQNGDQFAFILDANSPRQTTIGYDTNCCQHLKGVGESAMMYGLLAENAGFWAIEQKHKIVAQAEIWLGLLDNKEVLVFDNIELANDRDFNLIRRTLEKWLEASPYENIIMGTGYNVLSHGYEFVNGDLVQPKCNLVPNPYTDAKECVWLKKEGEVQYVKEDKKDE